VSGSSCISRKPRKTNFGVEGTQDVLPVFCQFGGEVVILVDTPGFSDTHLSDTEILKRIATWLKDSYDDGVLLSAIIYLHRIDNTRVEGPSLKNLNMMKKLCGTQSLKNVVLATTMWEKVSLEEGSRREEELKSKFWKDMIDQGSVTKRIHANTNEVARTLVKSLLRNEPTVMQLQQELHEGKALSETLAGTAIGEEIAKMERKLKEELREKMREIEEAHQRRMYRLLCTPHLNSDLLLLLTQYQCCRFFRGEAKHE
jgi:hypothetical protein